FVVRDCTFQVAKGIWVGENLWGHVEGCTFHSAIDDVNKNFGIFSRGNNFGIHNSRIQHFYDGIRVASYSTHISNMEIEVCRTGIAVGYDENRVDYPAGVVIQNCVGEGNGYMIDLNWLSNSVVAGATHQGHDPVKFEGNTPGPLPIPGVTPGNEGNK